MFARNISVRLKRNPLTAGLARKDAAPSSLLQSSNCSELESLAQAREQAFTEYLSARRRLSSSEAETAGHTAAAEIFEAARLRLRLTQSNWEDHVAAHHIG